MGVTVEAAARVGTGPVRPAHRPAVLLAAALTSASLLAGALASVMVPMAAKALAPGYGGAPTVWCTTVLFSQVMLFAGCCWAHLSQRLLGPRRQPLGQILLVAAPALVLPAALPASAWPQTRAPVALWPLLMLAAAVGPPIAMLAATGPSVQRWHHWSVPSRPGTPWLLYASGAAGGVLGLLAYPFLIEPAGDVTAQLGWWGIGYGVFAVLMTVCGTAVRFRVVRGSAGARAHPAVRISWRRRLRWLVLAFVPPSVTLSVTAHLSADIAAMPLVWVLPMAICLGTLVPAFAVGGSRWVAPAVAVSAVSAVTLPWVCHLAGDGALVIAVMLALVLVAGLACHGALAADRPPPSRLTGFFVVVSFGGVLAGAFNVFAAPVFLGGRGEFSLAVAAMVLPLALGDRPDARLRHSVAEDLVRGFVLVGPIVAVATYLRLGGRGIAPLLAGGLPWCVFALARPRMMAIAAALSTAVLLWYQEPANSFQRRTFFGDYRVYGSNGWQVLSDGTTIYGYQAFNAPLRSVPVSYYGSPGPLGDLFEVYGSPGDRVAVIGLGTGAVAGHGRPGRQLDFYETDPAVVDIALRRFGHLNGTAAGVTVNVGDGRLRIGAAPDAWYAMIIVDVVASRYVSPHLLTREALGTYVRKLRPGGVLAFHVTDRDLDLVPMLAATARAAGLVSAAGHGTADPRRIHQASTWVAVARQDIDLHPLRARPWQWHTPPPRGPIWTDTRTPLSGLLRLG